MTISHHPADDLLLGYAAGTLDQGQHVAIATHLQHCAQCRGLAHDLEGVGGSMLDDLPPTPMADDALAQLAARLDEADRPEPAPASPSAGNNQVPGLPPFVRSLAAGKWKNITPKVAIQRLALTAPGDTRLFLLRAKAGVKMLPHGHNGAEMTCVLTGSFSHDGLRYGPGDFDYGDGDNSHQIVIGPEAECICLVAMQGELKFKGLLGRLVQPFVSL